MPLYRYTWNDGDVSVVYGEDREEAVELLDEQGTARAEDLVEVRQFAVTFSPKGKGAGQAHAAGWEFVSLDRCEIDPMPDPEACLAMAQACAEEACAVCPKKDTCEAGAQGARALGVLHHMFDEALPAQHRAEIRNIMYSMCLRLQLLKDSCPGKMIAILRVGMNVNEVGMALHRSDLAQAGLPRTAALDVALNISLASDRHLLVLMDTPDKSYSFIVDVDAIAEQARAEVTVKPFARGSNAIN